MHITSLYIPTIWSIYLLSFPDMIRYRVVYVLFLEMSMCMFRWGVRWFLTNHMSDFPEFSMGSTCFDDTTLQTLTILF